MANAALLHWIAGMGAVGTCTLCARLEEAERHLRPELGWITDQTLTL